MKKALLLVVALAGCTTIPEIGQTPAEREILAFNFRGLQMGSRSTSLVQFPQVRQLPSPGPDQAEYEVFNPSPQVSIAKVGFFKDSLRRIELRYFDGPGARTLSLAGGWAGIRDYLMSKYGPPSKFGPEVPVDTTQSGIQGKYAKFNGVWIFSRVSRQLNYVALADGRGGVGIVTVTDTTPIPKATPTPRPTPLPTPAPPPKPRPSPSPGPNPGF